MSRISSDPTFTHVPLLGWLPGGSGDGLCASILYEWNEGFSLENSVFVVGKGRSKLIDLTKIESTLQPDPIYSFLLFMWGIGSDSDLESEVIRFIGKPRFYLWAAWRFLFLRTYSCKLVIKDDRTQKLQKFDKNITFLWMMNLPYLMKGTFAAPMASSQDGINHCVITDTTSKLTLMANIVKFDDGDLFRKVSKDTSRSSKFTVFKIFQ